MILGSGLGYLGDLVENAVVVPYGEIPNFRVSTAPGHKGQLVFGTLEGRNVAVMQGRMHHYEGYSYEEVSYAVRVLRLLGCTTLIVTNAAGCINKDWKAGDLMLISDQMKFFMESPPAGGEYPGVRRPLPRLLHLYTPRPAGHGPADGGGAGDRSAGGRLHVLPRAPVRDPRRDPGRPGAGGPTRRACPPRRRSSPPATAACRCWALPC